MSTKPYTPGHDFELDLAYGQEGERWMQSLIREGRNVEVKRDRMAIKTGNIAIDLDTLYHEMGDAQWWTQLLETQDKQVAPSGVLTLRVKRLKEIAENSDDVERLGGITLSKRGRRLLLIPIEDPYWIKRLLLP